MRYRILRGQEGVLARAQVITKEVIKEVVKEVIKEVPKEVVKEVVKEVPKEVIKEVVKEVPRDVIKEVPKEVTKTVTVETISPITYVGIGLGIIGIVVGAVISRRRQKVVGIPPPLFDFLNFVPSKR